MEIFPFVIVGAGPAGGRAAIELAGEGRGSEVALIGAEKYLAYERPPLSKELLLAQDRPAVPYVGGIEEICDQGARVYAGRSAIHLDAASQTLTLDNGEVIGYGNLLLAMGASVRRINLPGADLEGVFYLRDFDDALALRSALRANRQVVVIGGGFIGLEVAACARSLGLDVTVVEAGAQLMGRAAPPQISETFLKAHRARGVDVRLGLRPVEILGDKDRVSGVLLESGETVAAGAVVVGIGVTPNVKLAEQAGITVNNGIVTDAFGLTSKANIYAAGDVANQALPLFGGAHLRQEAWQSALDQGMAVAKTMLGNPTPYSKVPWVWSNQFDLNLQIAGLADGVDNSILRGDPDRPCYTLFQLKEGRLIGGITVNNGRDMALLRRAIGSNKIIDAGRLADSTINLRTELL